MTDTTRFKTPQNDAHGNYSIKQLPSAGLVLHQDFLTYPNSERRIMPVSPATWRRRQAIGDAPPNEYLFGRAAQHAEHIRAILLGEYWCSVVVKT